MGKFKKHSIKRKEFFTGYRGKKVNQGRGVVALKKEFKYVWAAALIWRTKGSRNFPLPKNKWELFNMQQVFLI